MRHKHGKARWKIRIDIARHDDVMKSNIDITYMIKKNYKLLYRYGQQIETRIIQMVN